MTNSKQWTTGRITLLIFAFINVLIIAVWLVVYYQQYEKISAVIKSLWGAILAILGFLGYKKVNKQASLAAIIGKPPLNILIVTSFILNLVASVLIILWDFQIYTVSLKTPELPDDTEVKIVWEGVDSLTVTKKENSQWTFKRKRGEYQVRVEAKGYHSQFLQISVAWPLKHELTIEKFRPVDGYLELTYEPASLPLDVTIKRNEKTTLQKQAQNGKEIFQLVPADYEINAGINGYVPFSHSIKITSRDTTRFFTRLAKVDISGQLEIKTQPEGMEIFIQNKFSGYISPHNFRLSPDHYKIELKKKRTDNYGFYAHKDLFIKAGKKTTLDTTLNAIELCKLTIFPEKKGLNYYLDTPDNSIGQLNGTKTIFVFPGEHRILKNVDGQYQYSEVLRITEINDNVVRF